MGNIGAISCSYDVLPLGQLTLAELTHDTEPSPGVPAPEPMPAPYPEPVPEPAPIPGPPSAAGTNTHAYR